MRPSLVSTAISALVLSSFSSGCVKSMATGALADALSGSGGTYGRDEDPELIAGAVPFGLKTMEGVLVEEPEHRGLLLALASGFTQYGYAFVEQDADRIAESDIDQAIAVRRRARKLYLRARDYGLRGLEVDHAGFTEKYKTDPEGALAMTDSDDVALLYWTAASWGLAIGAAKDDPEAIADFPKIGPLARRALLLDEAWNQGTLHEFFISYESGAPDGKVEEARKHYARAVELSGGRRVGPFVTLAENVSVKEQNKKEFSELIERALAVDLDASPNDRLANVIFKRRAERLKKAAVDLFLEE